MRTRLLRFGLVALSVAPLFAACGSDGAGEFKPASADDGGEGGDTEAPEAGSDAGGSGNTTPEGGAGGAAGAPVEGEGGAGGMPAVSAGAAGEGGAGGAPWMCSDADEDGDGVTECDGDCKDIKPYMFPGNPEICGDNIDQDCSFTADDPCGGLGTFVSALRGTDTGPGTTEAPWKTIAQGMTAAATIQLTTQAPIEVYVAEGSYNEKVTLVDGISLLGAYSCPAAGDPVEPCSWARDQSLYVSAIVNQDLEGVLAGHNVYAATKIDGFTIVGKFDDNTAPAYPGTAGITVDGGSPTISNNIISAGDSQVPVEWYKARSVGIAVLSPTNDPVGVIIQDNTISAGSSLGHSTGILFDHPGTTDVPFKSYAVVTGNRINADAGVWTYGIWARNTGDGTLIQDNSIAGGQASGPESSSFGIYVESNLAIDSNRINPDSLALPSCTNTAEFCGGIFSLSSTSEITNNIIMGVTSASRSAGVYLTEIEVPAGSVVLNSNSIEGGGNKGDGENLSAAVAMFLGGCCGSNGSIGRIANNLLNAGHGNQRFGLWETNSATRYIHPDWLYNNAFYNDVSDTPAVSYYYRFWDGAAYLNKATIDEVNTPHATQFVSVGGNIEGDCGVDDTKHLADDSACIDAGVSFDAPAFDYEGDARPFGEGYDIGADEAD